jgi:hypothetical protein
MAAGPDFSAWNTFGAKLDPEWAPLHQGWFAVVGMEDRQSSDSQSPLKYKLVLLGQGLPQFSILHFGNHPIEPLNR